MDLPDWPTWPDNDEGEVLADKEITKNIDELILIMQGGRNDFREKVISGNGWQNYTITEWKSSVEEANSASTTTNILSTVNDLKPGMASKRTFLSAPTMGNRYPTTEMSRIISITPGKQCTLESCVITTAPYGDKFRIILRSVFSAMNPTTTRLTIKFATVYVGKINGMVKGMVAKGARDGMVKSQTLQESVLKEIAEVRPYGSVQMAAALPTTSVPVPTPPPPPPPPAGGSDGVLAGVFGASLIDALSPWASFIHALLAHLPIFKHGLSQNAILAISASTSMLGMLRVGLALLRFIQSAGQHPTDFFALLSYYLCKIIHIPYSMSDVVTTYIFVLVVKHIVNTVAEALPQPPSGSGGGLSGRSSRHSRRPSSSALDDQEASGVKYDGYHQAIASASMQIQQQQQQQGRLHSGNSQELDYKRGIEELNQRSEIALEQIRKGLSRVTAPFTPRDGSMPHPLINKIQQHHQQQRGRKHHKKHGKEGRSRSASRSVDPVTRKSKGHYGKQRRGKSGSKEASPSSMRSDAVSAGVGGAVQIGSDDGDRLEATASSLSTATAVTPDAASSKDREHANIKTTDLSLYPAPDQHLMIQEGYCPPDLPSILRGKAVVEVVYENQRLQPFRGWGHSWPGHFLPTDKILHWSLRDSYGDDIATSQSIDDVAPGLPPRWRWAEEGWYLDLSGVLTDSMDNQGWAYGLDFHYVTYPFAPGAGRKRMADFVRRRRWLRTRIPDIKATGNGPAFLETIVSGAVLNVHEDVYRDDSLPPSDIYSDPSPHLTPLSSHGLDEKKASGDGIDDSSYGCKDNKMEGDVGDDGNALEDRMARAMSQSILRTVTPDAEEAIVAAAAAATAAIAGEIPADNDTPLQPRPSALVIPSNELDTEADIGEVSLNAGTIERGRSDVGDGDEVEQDEKRLSALDY